MIKTISTGVAAGALLFVAACGSDSDTLSDARTEINTADTLQSTSDITMDFEAPEHSDQDSVDPGMQGMLNMINGLSLTLDMKSDNVEKLHEMNITAEIANGDSTSMNFDIPLFMDENNEAVYISANTAADFSSMFMMPIELPEEHAGKVINLTDMSDIDDAETETTSKLETLTPAEANDIMQEYLDSLPDDAITKDGDVYTQTFNGNNFIDYMLTELQVREYMTAEDVESFNTDFKESVSIGDIVVNSTIKNGTITHDAVEMPITALNAGEPNGTLTLHVNTEYTAIDEDIEFDMNISDDNVLSSDEFQTIIENAMPY